eukprot:TRINITY_DN32763_c0_g1_i1.p1 TRINITY_DN32763_c0_g1~~TRINITY_DN32763_c0_g1_i1.p1  ORF type:complete len:1634 (-),score=284.78 TRINITY_DN32763_c0_g1_i1:32-4933(-)
MKELFLLVFIFSVQTQAGKLGSSSRTAAHNALVSTFNELEAAHASNWDLSKLESSLLKLSKAGSTPALQPLAAHIGNLLWNQLMPEIFKQHNLSQDEMDSYQVSFDGCVNATGLDNKSISDLSDAHKTCRMEEGSLYQQSRLIQAQIKLYENKVVQSCTNATDQAKLPTDLDCVCDRGHNITADLTYEGYAKRVYEYFVAANAAYEEAQSRCTNDTLILAELKKNQSNVTDQWTNKTNECDGKQRRLDSAACSKHLNHNYCKTRKRCIEDAFDRYTTGNTTIVEGVLARYGLWRGLKRIECLLSALTIEDSQVYGQIQKCHQTEYVCPANLTIHYLYRKTGRDPFDIRCNAVLPDLYFNDDTDGTTVDEEYMGDSDHVACQATCEQKGDSTPPSLAGCMAWMWVQSSSGIGGTCKRYNRYPNYQRVLRAGDALLGLGSYTSGYCNSSKIEEGVERCLTWKGLELPSTLCTDTEAKNLLPGTPSYEAAEYDVLPPSAPAAECIAECCTTCVLYPCNSSTTLRDNAAGISRMTPGSFTRDDNPTCCKLASPIQWVFEDWSFSSCSSACGQAGVYETRTVECKDVSTNISVEESQCPVLKPASIRQKCPATLPCDTCDASDCGLDYALVGDRVTCPGAVCNRTDCCVHVAWKADPFNEPNDTTCSNACGQPALVVSRSVSCVVDQTGREAPGKCDLIPGDPPASEKEICAATQACPVCSAENCPSGTVIAASTPKCRGPVGAECDPNTCCVPVVWTYNRWTHFDPSICPTTCGTNETFETRSVECREVYTGDLREDELCDGTKPATQRIRCPATTGCVAWSYLRWTAWSASSCNNACGQQEVLQTRTVECRELNGSKAVVNDTQCHGEKPTTVRRMCPKTPPCFTCMGHTCEAGYVSKEAAELNLITCANSYNCTTAECCRPVTYEAPAWPNISCNNECGVAAVKQNRSVQCKESQFNTRCKETVLLRYYDDAMKDWVDNLTLPDDKHCKSLCEHEQTCLAWNWLQITATSGTCYRYARTPSTARLLVVGDIELSRGSWSGGACDLPSTASSASARRIFEDSLCITSKPAVEREGCPATAPCGTCSTFTCPMDDVEQDCKCFPCGASTPSEMTWSCQAATSTCSKETGSAADGCFTEAINPCNCSTLKAPGSVTLERNALHCGKFVCSQADCCREPHLAISAVRETNVSYVLQRGDVAGTTGDVLLNFQGSAALSSSGYSYSFSGQTGQAFLPLGTMLSKKLTVEAFVKTSAGTAGTVVQKNGGYNNAGLWAIRAESDGTFSAHSYKNNHWETQISCNCTTNMSGIWTHLALTYNGEGSFLAFFVNGSKCCTMAAASNSRWSDEGITELSSEVIVGFGGIADYFDGDIHDVRVWDTEATESEVSSLAAMYTTAGHQWGERAALLCGQAGGLSYALQEANQSTWSDCASQCSSRNDCRAAMYYPNDPVKPCYSLAAWTCDSAAECGCAPSNDSQVANFYASCSNTEALSWRIVVVNQLSSETETSFTELAFLNSSGNVIEPTSLPADQTGTTIQVATCNLNDGSRSAPACTGKTRSAAGFIQYDFTACQFPTYLAYAKETDTETAHMPSQFFVSYQGPSGYWVDCDAILHESPTVTGIVRKAISCPDLSSGQPLWWK